MSNLFSCDFDIEEYWDETDGQGEVEATYRAVVEDAGGYSEGDTALLTEQLDNEVMNYHVCSSVLGCHFDGSELYIDVLCLIEDYEDVAYTITSTLEELGFVLRTDKVKPYELHASATIDSYGNKLNSSFSLNSDEEFEEQGEEDELSDDFQGDDAAFVDDVENIITDENGNEIEVANMAIVQNPETKEILLFIPDSEDESVPEDVEVIGEVLPANDDQLLEASRRIKPLRQRMNVSVDREIDGYGSSDVVDFLEDCNKFSAKMSSFKVKIERLSELMGIDIRDDILEDFETGINSVYAVMQAITERFS